MTSLVSYETFVNQCADIFAQRLQDMADTGESINMRHWFQCYAFDVIACITYGSRFGFLDRGDDIRGMMGDLHALLRYSTLVGIVPWLHGWIFYPASKLQLFGAKGRVTIMDFVKRRMAVRECERQLAKSSEEKKAREEGVTKDFLDRLLDQHEDNPDKTTMYHVFLVGLANINAGSDTTATSLSGILYYLLKTPRVLAKLKEEIESFTASGQLSANPTFKETQRMPYFDVVVKEALRLHSAVGLPLWRVVPEGGVDMAGHYLPAGTKVGINAWVAVSPFRHTS
jgi:cytochrome P450